MIIQPLLGPKGKLPILIRDDDINYFTKERMLETIYSDAWNAGFKVSLSVIPCQAGVDDFCVPPQERNTDLPYSIADNHSLVKYLKDKIYRQSVEILQHGLHHNFDAARRGEFGGTSSKTNSILKGRNIIAETFGKKSQFFVPPGEDISNENLKIILQLGMIPIYRNTVFDRFLRDRRVPKIAKKISFKIIMSAYKAYMEKSIPSVMKPVVLSPMMGFIEWSIPRRKFANLKSNEQFSRFSKDTINFCSINRRPICILNHYHSYFYDWSTSVTKKELFREWIELMKCLHSLKFGWKVSFMDLYDRFLQIQKVKIKQTGSKITIRTGEEVNGFSFLISSPIEQNSIADYDKETKICTINNIQPESQITIYIKS